MPTLGVIHRLATIDYAESYTFFVTFCVRHRIRPFGDPRIAKLAKDAIIEYRDRGWYRLWCYCVMPDHVHLMLKLPGKERSLSRVVASLKNRISYRSRDLNVRIVWQNGFHDRVKRSFERLEDYASYILANPVRAGIVTEYTSYPFCGVIDAWS